MHITKVTHIAGGGGGGLSSSGKFGNLGPQKYDFLHFGYFFVLSIHQSALLNFQHVLEKNVMYTRKNAEVVTSLQTSCNKSVHKLSTSCFRTACS